jgi:DNA polymerase elongation subunit (family B)
MPEVKEKVSNERIESFLQGTDPQQYIVAVEADFYKPKVTLVVNDPETGKRLEEHKYKPFLWFKEEITTLLYGGKRMKIIENASFYGVKITKLRTSNQHGISPKRMEDGYKYMATCTKSYNDLIQFFKDGGVDIFGKDENDEKYSKYFVMFSPSEQFLIQTGKRLFKGMEDYDDIHRFQFDLETTGLFPSKDSIFQIGVRDNRDMEYVLETLGETPHDKRNSERENIEKFFQIIDIIKPDVITGYNSENFDWPFIFERAERLSIPITELAITLNRLSKIKRKPAKIKLGGETEAYHQTHMYGYNIIDIAHAVRRAMAINSEIKGWGLKYITQYSGIAKPNRVYVAGDKINSTWADKVNSYAFNDTNGDWYMITDKKPLKPDYKIVKGDYIVQRYLCDDLWETEQIDNLFNQASFLISKILPTTFMRSSTMGTAGQWKLIMAAWSYENGLAIPETQPKRDFTGGLSRLLEVGFAMNVYKFDYAALYPKTQLTHDIFPDLDISGVMEGMLTYVVDTRDHFKFLTGIEKNKAKKLEARIKADPKTMSEEEIQEINARVASMDPSELEEIKKQIAEHKRLSNLYDKKQLPLKILANSWFGSYGAPYIFNWGETDSAEETTCRGRQYLRLMIRVFTEKYGFRPLVMDTDGANLAAPSNLESFRYLAKGSHWKTTEDAGKELTGFNAVLAEFNETYMEGRMGLDLDDVCNSTINFARKNYANDIGGKIKLVGNSVKSKKMSVYIEDFLAKSIRMLLDGDGHSFIKYYHEYVDKIYNFQIPLVKIASKAKVKLSIPEYKLKGTKKNKAGNPLPKQAHMELAIRDNLDVSLGDVLYYINTGSAKSHGDLKTVDKNKMTKKEREIYYKTHGVYPQPNKVVELNCKLINPTTVEHDFELVKELEVLKKALLTLEEGDSSISSLQKRIDEIDKELFTDEYNVSRYLDAFNKKVKPLLVCFSPEIRDKILLDIVKIKDKETKTTIEKLKDRVTFTKAECELVSGMPFKETDQDSYEDLMRMEDKEIRFWTSVDKIPNNLEDESKWPEIVADYHERMRIARLEGIQNEKDRLEENLKRLEVEDYRALVEEYRLPVSIFTMADVMADDDGVALISRKWDVVLCRYDYIFKYEKEAKKRAEYYALVGSKDGDDLYEDWLNYIAEQKMLSGNTITIDFDEDESLITRAKMSDAIEVVQNLAKNIIKIEEEKVEKKKRTFSEGGDEEDEELEEDENGDLIRTEENINLDDEIDDTFPEVPEDYVVNETIKEEKEDDGFPF